VSYQDILYEQDGAVVTITLNRPDKLNAYTATMGLELEDAFRAADEDDSVRAIVVTGAGRAFCAGADISSGASAFDVTSGQSRSMGNSEQRARRATGGRGAGFIGAIYDCRKPSIAAFNGPAVGVGLTLTLPMDIRIAAAGTKFGFVFARRGLVPEAASAWFLPQLVGLSQSLKWCLTGQMFKAEDALEAGLVSEVVAQEQVLNRAKELAREIAEETSPVAVALTRQMLWRFSGAPDYRSVLAVDGPLITALGSGADVKEGVMAFLEKRKPKFPSKVSTDMPAAYPWWKE
jgi:enoyl-CoA hydratase/carnithine racemase